MSTDTTSPTDRIEYDIHATVRDQDRVPEYLTSRSSVSAYSDASTTDNFRMGVRCVIYPTGSRATVMIWTRTTSPTLFGAPRFPRDIDTQPIFPNGCISTRFDTMFNGFPLTDGYRIFMSHGIEGAPINKCVKSKFGHTWFGNLMLAKHARCSGQELSNIQLFEPDGLNIFVGMWLELFLQGPKLYITLGSMATSIDAREHITGPDELSQVIVPRPRSKRSATTSGARVDSINSLVVNRTSIKCLLYPTYGYRSEIFETKTVPSAGASTATPYNLNLSSMFPLGYYSIKLTYIPGTSYPLAHGVRIFVSHQNEPKALNGAVESLFDLRWYGNILVVKYGKRINGQEQAINTQQYDSNVLDVILGMWLEEFVESEKRVAMVEDA